MSQIKKEEGGHSGSHGNTIALLALTALGVVYGDIGTSPLYAVNEVFFGKGGIASSPENILGSISLIVWLLTIIVTLKYIVFVLRAEYEGNGGVFSLLGIVSGLSIKKKALLLGMLVLAAGLLFGEGIITPAISVLSAVEGLKVATSIFDPYIIPITLAILTGLFAIQVKGTKKVGTVFGPVMIVWFMAISILGLRQIVITPAILQALNPIHIFYFLSLFKLRSIMFILGSVMLSVTGVEALYADMGHFGVGPIRLSWASLVYPALILVYLGQGAFLLSGQQIIGENVFYSLVPHFFIYPMVILATFATVIASQALISGAYSLIAQAISLNYSPRFKIDHKNVEHEGQIYVGAINWMLYFGCISLVLFFKSSTNLAAAYGFAVSGVMFSTSVTMAVVSRVKWKWALWKSLAVFGTFALIDACFVFSNSVKFLDGGYIPLGIGLAVFSCMMMWNAGRKTIKNAYRDFSESKQISWLIDLKKRVEEGGGAITDKLGRFVEFDRAVIFLAAEPVVTADDFVPALIRVYLKRQGGLPKYIFILHLSKEKEPYLHKDGHMFKDFGANIFSIQAKSGFMETPDVKALLREAKKQFPQIDCDIMHATIEVGDADLVLNKNVSFLKKVAIRFYRGMAQGTIPAYKYFGLNTDFDLSRTQIPISIENGKKPYVKLHEFDLV